MDRRFKRACLYALPLLIVIVHSNFFYAGLTASEAQDIDDQTEFIEETQDIDDQTEFMEEAQDIDEATALIVHNLSKTTMYAATYCENFFTGNATRTSAIIRIPAKGAGLLARPSFSLACTRRIIFSCKPDELTESLSDRTPLTLGSVGIGTTSGGILARDFYITNEDDKLNGYNSYMLGAKDMLAGLKTFFKTTYDAELEIALQKSLHFKADTHQHEIAHVRISDSISTEEAQFITKRKQINKVALEKLLEKELNNSYIPTIAFVSGGSGARALICSLGMHVGAEKSGLLNCITYNVGLSGGSWLVALWQQSQQSPYIFKLEMKAIMARSMDTTQPGNFSLSEAQNILNGALFRTASEQPTTFATLWGAMLANRYLSLYKPYSQDILFSELYEKNTDAHQPLPILATVNGRFDDANVDLEKAGWFEFTPIEAGGIGDWLGDATIPMWSLGRTFKANVSIDTKAEYDMGQLMGICGSTLALTMGGGFVSTIRLLNPIMAFVISTALGKEILGSKHLSVGKIPNFTKDVADSVVNGFDDLRLADAGLAFELPIPPVLHPKRRADIMILMDASFSTIGSALKKAENYARYHNLPFPPITYGTMTTKALHIFESDDPEVPTVIHLSRTIDRGRINYSPPLSRTYTTLIPTDKFQYTAEEFDALSGVTEANLSQNIELIKDAIARKIQQHNGFAN